MAGEFFKQHEHVCTLFLSSLDVYKPENEHESLRAQCVRRALKNLVANASDFEAGAQISIRRHGETLIALLQAKATEDTVTNVSYILARMVKERLFRTGSIFSDTMPIFSFFSYATFNLTPSDIQEINIDQALIYTQVINDQLRNHRLGIDQANNEISVKINDHTSNISRWEDSIKESISTLQSQRDYIDKLKSDFNFLGLSKAFGDMETKTSRAKLGHFISLISMGIIMVCPLAISAFLLLNNIYSDNPLIKHISTEQYLLAAPAILSLELVLIYFFRIVLKNYQSLRTLILQLRHRQALCAFIQNYMDFRKNHSDNTVDKFEALIFSGLSSDPDKIPSTFDGMEQLLRLVKAARGEGE